MEIIEIATTYLDALLSHDADSVPLAPDACRINNGKLAVEGEDAMREIIRREPVAATSRFQWLVDGDQAIVFYDLDADLGRREDTPPGPPATWIPAYVGERFQIRGGRIEEIEVVYAALPDQPRPARPTLYPPGSDDRDQVLSSAKAYVSALGSRDASEVPLAEKVWRVENGTITGHDANSLRASLESKIMHTIQGVDEESWFAAGDSAAVFYTLHVGGRERDIDVRIAERFRVVDGRIVEIEVVFAPKGS